MECDNCGARFQGNSRAEAIERWNRRSPSVPTAIQEQREADAKPSFMTREWCLAMAAEEAKSDRSLAWQVVTLRSALENWGRHFVWCNRGMQGDECSCGFDDAMRGEKAGISGGTLGQIAFVMGALWAHASFSGTSMPGDAAARNASLIFPARVQGENSQ